MNLKHNFDTCIGNAYIIDNEKEQKSNPSKVIRQNKKNFTLQCLALLDCLRVLERLVLHIYIFLLSVLKSNKGDILFVLRRIVVTLLPTRQQNDNDNICGLYDSPWRQKNKFCTKEKE